MPIPGSPSARSVFGGTPQDFCADRFGNLIGGVAGGFPVYLNAALTQPALDLLDRDGNLVTTGIVTPNASGYYRFSGPDGVTELWISDGAGGSLALFSPGVGGGGQPVLVVVDNGDGTTGITGLSTTDNGDGTSVATLPAGVSVTDNHDGTLTLAY